jgi:integrase
MTKKMTFTPTSIEALKAGSILDPLNPGLSILALPSGKKMWKYTRRLGTMIVKTTFGSYPALNIGAARTKAQEWNRAIEIGEDPRGTVAASALTMDEVHALYMKAVRANLHKVRKTTKAKPLKPRTIIEKEEMYIRNVKPALGSKLFADITAKDLTKIIIKVGEVGNRGKPAPIQANRTLAELRVIFTWAGGLRAKEQGVHITTNPMDTLGQLWIGESGGRTRWLEGDELPLFLKALAHEDRLHRRALLLLLLTGCRKMEVMQARTDEYKNDMWVIPGERTKNGGEHPIVLGPWGKSLFLTNDVFVIPTPKAQSKSPSMIYGWNKVLERVRQRMEEISGGTVDPFTLHDLRRTFRSHVDEIMEEAICELMLNHLPTGLKARYNRNKRAKAMEAGFAAWEASVIAMTMAAGISVSLDVPASLTMAETPPTPSLQTA